MTSPAKSFPVTKRVRYATLLQQRSFVRAALDRKVTPEVASFLAKEAENARRASSAGFLDRFRSATSA